MMFIRFEEFLRRGMRRTYFNRGLYASQTISRGNGLREQAVDLIQDTAAADTCRERFTTFTFPAGAFHQIADFKIKSAFESIFGG